MSDNQVHGVLGDGKLAGAILQGALGGATGGPLMGAVKGAVTAALQQKAAAAGGGEPTVTLTRAEIEAIAKNAVEHAAATPEVQYAQGDDPWYKSRAVWSAITAVATPILAITGYTLSPEVKDCVAVLGVNFGPVVAGTVVVVGGGMAAVLAWWERRASKPIGG